MTQQFVQVDPLDSPHPVPWNWVMANIAEVTASNHPSLRYYRSQALMSPDGQYAAYSRIQMQVQPEFFRSRVSSVLFLENLRTGDLRAITAAAPFSDHPFMTTREDDMSGTVAILIPVAWSETGDRILSREFESLFGSDLASDYAVVWDRHLDRTSTVAPTRIQYTNAVLLGWSQSYPDRILFRAGNIGETQWPLWTVDLSGQTITAPEDRPQVFGRTVSSIWTGPQAYL